MLAKPDALLSSLRVITKKELRLIVPYTPQQILRLENQERFPKRVRIGENRVGWVLVEVGHWLRARLIERGGPYPKAFDTLDDFSKLRIIIKKELRGLVPYVPAHILRLENEGKFPRRIKVGENRVGWVLSEVQEWLLARMALRNGQPAGEGQSKDGKDSADEEVQP